MNNEASASTECETSWWISVYLFCITGSSRTPNRLCLISNLCHRVKMRICSSAARKLSQIMQELRGCKLCSIHALMWTHRIVHFHSVQSHFWHTLIVFRGLRPRLFSRTRTWTTNEITFVCWCSFTGQLLPASTVLYIVHKTGDARWNPAEFVQTTTKSLSLVTVHTRLVRELHSSPREGVLPEIR